MIVREARQYIDLLHAQLGQYERELESLSQSNRVLMQNLELLHRLAQQEGWEFGVPLPREPMTVAECEQRILRPLQQRVEQRRAE